MQTTDTSKTEPRPSASWWTTYDRASSRGDSERIVELLAMTKHEKSVFNARDNRRPKA